MAKAVSLFSGSKGNSYYIGTSSEGVLIDAGRNCKQILLALEANELDIKKIGGIFITHEHTDHCSALKVLTKKYDIKIYGSAGTLEAMVKADRINPDAKVEVIDKEIEIGNMLVKRINTSHDAAESCCYRVITADGKSALIATDMGVMLPKVRESAQKSDFVVLESNHDIDMLKNGIYPFTLKRRILSDRGHLSNVACANELVELVKNGTLRLMLGHLSEENNTPALALRTSVEVLENAGMKYRSDFTLDIAPSEVKINQVIY